MTRLAATMHWTFYFGKIVRKT